MIGWITIGAFGRRCSTGGSLPALTCSARVGASWNLVGIFAAEDDDELLVVGLPLAAGVAPLARDDVAADVVALLVAALAALVVAAVVEAAVAVVLDAVLAALLEVLVAAVGVALVPPHAVSTTPAAASPVRLRNLRRVSTRGRRGS
ncbi:MAG: hypothetical protein ACTHMU_12110, partial [Thermomicrobiales bacterium]